MDRVEETKYIGKIKKLLALSKSSNVHEAALAMEHAQRLMEEHNLTVQDMRISDIKSHTGPMAKAKTPAAYIQALAKMVADSFGCHIILTTREVTWGRWETSACFIGVESAAELAGYAFDVLRRQLERDRREHVSDLKYCKASTKTRRADAFCEAWVCQVRKKVRKLAISQEHEEAIAAWMGKEHPDIQEGKSRKSKDLKLSELTSITAGAAKGKDAYLNAGVPTTARRQIA